MTKMKYSLPVKHTDIIATEILLFFLETLLTMTFTETYDIYKVLEERPPVAPVDIPEI